MKKSKTIAFIATILMSSAFMIGCTSNNSNSKEPAESSSASESAVNDSNENTNNDASVTTTDKNDTYSNFYGKWTINSLVKSGKVSTHSQEDIDSILGTNIEFAENSITFKGVSYKNPVFSSEDMSSDALQSSFFMGFNDLNISGNTVKVVSLDSYDNMNELISKDEGLPGFTILIKDDNSLILILEGDFFELTK